MNRKDDLVEEKKLPSTELGVIMEELGRGGDFLSFPSVKAYYKAFQRRDIFEQKISYDAERNGKFGQIEWYLRPELNEEGKNKILDTWLEYVDSADPDCHIDNLVFDISKRGGWVLITCFAKDVEMLETKISKIIKDIRFANYEEDMVE